MRCVDSRTAESIGVQGLGFDSTKCDFSAVETLSALLRRCAAFNCPCSPSTLVRTALSLLNGVRDDQQSRDLISDLVEQLVSYGDFIESKEISGQSKARLLYLAPPAFVEVSPERFLILGVAADDNQIIPPDLSEEIEYQGHARIVRSSDRNITRAKLITAGLTEIPSDDWLRPPTPRTASDHVGQYLTALSRSQRAGSIGEFLVLNPDTPVRYYPGRWQLVKRQTGTYVARRPQAYGAHLWSFVELAAGQLKRVIDFPVYETRWRPCDEAWHVQQAVDANRGCAQLLRVRTATDTKPIIDVFSPIPAWAQRRWDYIGTRVPSVHSLLAYKFHSTSLQSELNFARERMWLAEAPREEA